MGFFNDQGQATAMEKKRKKEKKRTAGVRNDKDLNAVIDVQVGARDGEGLTARPRGAQGVDGRAHGQLRGAHRLQDGDGNEA